MGLVPPARGEVSFAGARIDRLPPYRIARLGLGYVPEERRIFTELTVMENLEVGRQAARSGAPTWDEDRLFALFPNLARHARAAGRAHVGRRAADADHRPHPDGQSASACCSTSRRKGWRRSSSSRWRSRSAR